MRKTALKRKTRLKAKGKPRFKKGRDPKFLAWVRQRYGCYVCGMYPADAAHVRSRGAGGADRGNVVALCRRHHMEQHRIGVKSFDRRYMVDTASAAQFYDRQYGYEGRGTAA